MAQAPRDNNRVPAILGVSSADGATPLPPYVDPATNRLLVNAVGASSPLASDTGTVTVVADNASSVTILAANTDRTGASVVNDSSAVLYLLLDDGTASSTNYTVRMVQYAYYEVPFGYTGQLTGIWASDPGDGAARVTEFE